MSYTLDPKFKAAFLKMLTEFPKTQSRWERWTEGTLADPEAYEADCMTLSSIVEGGPILGFSGYLGPEESESYRLIYTGDVDLMKRRIEAALKDNLRTTSKEPLKETLADGSYTLLKLYIGHRLDGSNTPIPPCPGFEHISPNLPRVLENIGDIEQLVKEKGPLDREAIAIAEEQTTYAMAVFIPEDTYDGRRYRVFNQETQKFETQTLHGVAALHCTISDYCGCRMASSHRKNKIGSGIKVIKPQENRLFRAVQQFFDEHYQEALRQETEEQERALSTQEVILRQLQGEHSKLEEFLALLEAEHPDPAKIAEIRAQNALLTQRKQELQQQLTEIQTETEQQLAAQTPEDDEIETLQRRLEELSRQSQELEDTAEQIHQKFTKVQEELDRVKREQSEFQNKFIEQFEEYDAALKLSYQPQIDELKERIGSLKQQLLEEDYAKRAEQSGGVEIPQRTKHRPQTT